MFILEIKRIRENIKSCTIKRLSELERMERIQNVTIRNKCSVIINIYMFLLIVK